jgi:hypothetical protein
MTLPTQEDVLLYARRIQGERAGISDEELRSALKAKFAAHDVGPVPEQEKAVNIGTVRVPEAAVTMGAVARPIDWLQGLAAIFRGLLKLFEKKTNWSGIQDIIDGVVKILADEKRKSTVGG